MFDLPITDISTLFKDFDVSTVFFKVLMFFKGILKNSDINNEKITFENIDIEEKNFQIIFDTRILEKY